MHAHDFAINTSDLESINTLVSTNTSSIETTVGKIYSEIDSFSTDKAWSGEAFEKFKTMCHSYEEDIDKAIKILKAYGKLFSDVSTDATALYSEVISLVEE